MSPLHAAEIQLVETDQGPCAVVTHADAVIWIADELMAEAADPGQAAITGGLERDGDLVTFGTPGLGLGRLTYRITEHRDVSLVHVAERQHPTGCSCEHLDVSTLSTDPVHPETIPGRRDPNCPIHGG